MGILPANGSNGKSDAVEPYRWYFRSNSGFVGRHQVFAVECGICGAVLLCTNGLQRRSIAYWHTRKRHWNQLAQLFPRGNVWLDLEKLRRARPRLLAVPSATLKGISPPTEPSTEKSSRP